jgi:hypothetical protein
MIDQLKKNNLTENAIGDLQKKNIYKAKRPNIDHLIKKILTERREANKKNSISIIVVVIAICIITFYVNNS